MSHPEQLAFFQSVQHHLAPYFRDRTVLEVGSLDVNGGIRELFTGGRYTGVDVDAGPGVDLVVEGQLLDLATGSVDVAVSAECFEHNPFWRETLANMARVTRPGGLVAWSCAYLGRSEHGTARSEPGSSPLTLQLGWTHYRNLRQRMVERAVHLDGWFSRYGFWLNYHNRDLYFAGLRRGAEPDLPTGAFAALDRELSAQQRDSWRQRWRRDVAVRVLGDKVMIELDLARRRRTATAARRR